jgi:hypothetical protein
MDETIAILSALIMGIFLGAGLHSVITKDTPEIKYIVIHESKVEHAK